MLFLLIKFIDSLPIIQPITFNVELINFKYLTTIEIVLLASFAGLFLVQMYFLLGVYMKLVVHKKEDSHSETKPVTIITSLRNEEPTIREKIEKLTGLPYNNYQVIVIDEFSEDNTLQLLMLQAEVNPKLKVTSLSQETRFLEKQAINIGMKGAQSEWVILIPSNAGEINEEWLTKLFGLTDNSTNAIIAYTNIERSKGFRNLICRLERFYQFMLSGAWILAGKPFVFQENNILFRKSIYFNTQGFRHKLNLNFANMELIFNENFSKGNVKVSTNPDLAIREKVTDDRGDHIKLIRKGVQIRQSLNWGKKACLFIDDFTKMAFLGLAITLFILNNEYWITFLSVLIVYATILSIIVKKLQNRLKEPKIFVYSFVYILIKPVINWWFFWSTYLINRRNRWN